jgi:trehalose-phosphatase
MTAAVSIGDLRHALRDEGELSRHFAGRRPAVFLDHDGTLTPIVDRLLAEHADELKVTPGKMVYEIQPRLEWEKGKAVLYLLQALRLDGDDVAPLYLGDDITNEDAFRALSGRGIGIFVGRADDPDLEGRGTSAAFMINSIEEVERFLDRLAR